jgi:hypothetical protein
MEDLLDGALALMKAPGSYKVLLKKPKGRKLTHAYVTS